MADFKLSEEDIAHFLKHGWIKIPSCFDRGAADKVTATLWHRLGITEDKSTWYGPELQQYLKAGRINMPSNNKFPAKEFAPKAWAGICQLLGGEEHISPEHETWNDGLIVNFGTPEMEGKDVPPQDLKVWHVDGDFFIHYLDSPEQGLLVIPLFTNIRPGGGGTYICPAAIKNIAQHLYNNPDGVSPRFTPRNDPDFAAGQESSLTWFNDLAASMPDDAFVEVTGEIGDVYLLHPLMLHCASNNKLRELRIITNPPVSLQEPFRLQRDDGAYTAVEQKTLNEIGMPQGVGNWKITHSRERVIPARLKLQAEMREKEQQRLKLESQPQVAVHG